jgi:hypothetical protein
MGLFSFDLKKAKKRRLRLNVLRTDGDTQPRNGIDQHVVNEYAEAYKAKRKMPPIHCVHDGSSFWVVDGFHRRFAADKVGLTALDCLVVPGTLEDARWLSYASNQLHGLRRSVEDKVRAVTAALKHPRAADMSDVLIAEHVGVSQPMVLKYRQLITVITSTPTDDPPNRTGKDGKAYPAKKPPRKAAPPPPDDTPEDTEEETEGDDNQACTIAKDRLMQFCTTLLSECDGLTPQLLAALLQTASDAILRIT